MLLRTSVWGQEATLLTGKFRCIWLTSQKQMTLYCVLITILQST